jgi:hypothetical protein
MQLMAHDFDVIVQKMPSLHIRGWFLSFEYFLSKTSGSMNGAGFRLQRSGIGFRRAGISKSTKTAIDSAIIKIMLRIY